MLLSLRESHPIVAVGPVRCPVEVPSVAWISPAIGVAPSGHPFLEQKLYSVVSVPLGVILKTVPQPKGAQLAPPPLKVVPYYKSVQLI